MEHNRRTKVVAIIALLVAVLGLSVGFAAYSKTLNIQNVQATVQGNSSNFNVVLSTSSTSASKGTVSGSGSGGTGAAATLNETTITGLTANFTAKGSIAYTFYVRNQGSLKAYLKGVTIGSRTCSGASGTDATLVSAACADVTISVKVGDATYSSTNSSISDTTGLAAGANSTVVVTIANSGTHAVDGNFTATYGNITLNYSTTKPA